MRYKAKSIAALQLALGSLPDKMRVEVEPDIAKKVGAIRYQAPVEARQCFWLCIALGPP